MAPAKSEAHLAARGQHLVGAIAVDLQHAAEPGEMGDRSLRLAIGRIDIGNAGRIGATPRSVVPDIGPELTGFGAPTSRVEHRRRRFVGQQLR